MIIKSGDVVRYEGLIGFVVRVEGSKALVRFPKISGWVWVNDLEVV